MATKEYRERRGTTPKSRTKAATHATSVMRTFEFPAYLPDGSDWMPSVPQVIDKTRGMYSITPTEDEAQAAIDTIRARHAN